MCVFFLFENKLKATFCIHTDIKINIKNKKIKQNNKYDFASIYHVN